MPLVWLPATVAGGRAAEEHGFDALHGSRTSGKRSWAEHRWHALGAIPFPRDPEAFERDLGTVIRESILTGHRPRQPPLTADDTVITLGSCFARNLRKALSEAGLEASTVVVPSGLNTTFALLDFVSWTVTGTETGRAFRYDRGGDGVIRQWKPPAERERYLRALREAGALVFTVGLAEVWQDRETGAVFWQGVPEQIFDAGRHEFRLSTVEENVANLEALVELVRAANPRAPIVLTLSPVPLKATFRPISCVSADCVSKSTLRLALDRVTSRARDDGVYYWPSFEIVRWAGAHLPYPTFGADGTARHVRRQVVGEIIDAFIEAFWVPEAAAELRRRLVGAPPSPPAGS